MDIDPMDPFYSLAERAAGEVARYPGSKRPTKAASKDWFDGKTSVTLTVRGEDVVFYPIGVLGLALDRRATTMRKWEQLGYLPDSGYRYPGAEVRGQRRLYTREQIEGLVEIATAAKLIPASTSRNVSATQFPDQAAKLFKALKDAAR